MNTLSFPSSKLLPQPFHSNLSPILPFRPKRLRITASAARNNGHDWGFGGRSVDEDMIVLRMRIHEMKMAEMNYEPPVHWMEWEKRYYTCYDSDVCEAVGLLQTVLMNTRPSLAIGIVAFVALSVPTSTVFIMFHLIKLAKSICSHIL
ncbi:uncharacterized protein LOC131230669 [Magnolia sinica]|uniref:uncharacterized protein LOC131230669 n=1 Tax=Magnolia sinica TaxID=86752 RepID=UPI002657B4EF|nr:uncharacterized protein LOC131230669 [Magnolia sinica]